MLHLKGLPFLEEVKRAELDGTPLILAPAVSASCNYRCIMCYAPSGNAPKGEIGLIEHKTVIDQIAKLGAKYMIIAMVGEPFMDPAFYNPSTKDFPLIDYANAYGIYVVVFTNGSLITPDIANRLKNKNVSVIGKLWSLDPVLDDELTGVPKKWAYYDGISIPEGLKYLVDAGFNTVTPVSEIKHTGYDTRLGVDIIVTAKNYREVPLIAKFALAHGIKPIIDTMIPTERAQHHYEALRLTNEQNKWLHGELVRILGKDFTSDQFVEGCAVRKAGFAYDNFGHVKVCCALGAHVGNIKETSVHELYGKIQAYRKTLPHYKRTVGTLNACDTAKFVKAQIGMD